jgi:hypothetical protein
VKRLITAIVVIGIGLSLLSGRNKSKDQPKSTEKGDRPKVAMFRANLHHTGVYHTKGVPQLHGVKWRFKTGGEVESSPAVADGVVYFGSRDGHLYALH